jgi:hypothetical protein
MTASLSNTIREDFDGPLDPAMWAVTQAAGSNMVAAVANQLLTIATGVTANDTISIATVPSFALPGRVKFIASLSQRIANQTFVLQVRNGAGDTLAAWVFDGVSATSAKVRAMRRGIAATADTAVAVPTTATVQEFEIDLRMEAVDFYTRASESTASAVVLATRSRTIPKPNEILFIELSATNGAVAPASSTTLTVEAVFFQDSSRNIAAEVVAGRGISAPGRGVPVNLLNAISATLVATANRQAVMSQGVWFDDSVAALAANAVFTGTTRDIAGSATGVAFVVASNGQEYRTSAESDQAFTLAIEVSRDNVTWRRVKTVASAAVTGGGQYAEIVHRPSWRYIRTVVVNGATLQTRLTVGSIIMAT